MLLPAETKEFLLRQLEKLSPDALQEVAQFIEFLQFRQQQPLLQEPAGDHVAFGLWADYKEANEPAAFAQTLRQKVEARRDV